MNRPLFFVILAFVASFATADPVVTSVSPREGPVAGGTVVTIKGTGFSNNCIICSPPFADPEVHFGSTRAASVKFIDSTTIEAVAPPHLPHTSSIEVRQHDGSSNSGILSNAFTFTGDPETAFDPILFPIFMPKTRGAYGSEFETSARVSNASRARGATATLYGLDTSCYYFSPITGPFDPIALAPDRKLLPDCSTSVGRLFWVSKGSRLAANLRVSDLSRQTSHGVEVPVATHDEFTQDQIVLLGVPIDPKFRLTLRIYSLDPGAVPVIAVNGLGIAQVHLTPGRDLFEPSYAVFTDFPEDLAPGSTVRVDVMQGLLPDGTINPDVPRIWAMISVTNNETQEITTITP